MNTPKVDSKLANPDRRSFVQKASYVAPLVLTLPAMPSIAQSGSGGNGNPDPCGGDNLTDQCVP